MMGGVYMSYHTAEIPFVFHNIDRAEKIIRTQIENVRALFALLRVRIAAVVDNRA